MNRSHGGASLWTHRRMPSARSLSGAFTEYGLSPGHPLKIKNFFPNLNMQTDSRRLIMDSSEEFFIKTLKDIQDFYHYRVSEECLLYVAHLLEKHMKLSIPSKPLAFLLEDALRSEKQDFQKYKKLGDASLLVGGLFPESVNVTDDYFILMGRTGYINSAVLFKPMRKTYTKLSEEFPEWMKTLRDFRYSIESEDPMQWEKLYEIVERTNSKYLKHLLGIDNIIFVDFKKKLV